MELYQFFDDGKAQAEMVFVASGGVSLVEAVKHMGLVLVRDPAPFIQDLDGQYLTLGIGAAADGDGAAAGGVVFGIIQES